MGKQEKRNKNIELRKKKEEGKKQKERKNISGSIWPYQYATTNIAAHGINPHDAEDDADDDADDDDDDDDDNGDDDGDEIDNNDDEITTTTVILCFPILSLFSLELLCWSRTCNAKNVIILNSECSI